VKVEPTEPEVASWSVFASFRIAEARQPNLLRLLDAVVAPSIERTMHRAPAALAIGFELAGAPTNVAELLALVRFAWKEEGSDVDTLVEIVGPTSITATLRTVDDWVALERGFRSRPDGAEVVELVTMPELLHIVGSDGLTWLDAENNLFGIVADTLCSFARRREPEISPSPITLADGPWQSDEVPTHAEVIGNGRAAVTVERGARSRLYLVERATLSCGRTIALPCTGPRIVGHAGNSLWITGMAPLPGAPRCDLFRVDLVAGWVQMLTAEIEVPTIDVALHPSGTTALLATPRAVYILEGDRARELMPLTPDERITGMAVAATSAVFVEGRRGARIVLGSGRYAVPLQSAGYAPRFL
jgi:hypothetical protein